MARLLENATGAADVYIDKTGIRVDDTPLQSPDELIALLAARNVKTARLHRAPDAGFENIGKVIYAVMRAGGDIDIAKPKQ